MRQSDKTVIKHYLCKYLEYQAEYYKVLARKKQLEDSMDSAAWSVFNEANFSGIEYSGKLYHVVYNHSADKKVSIVENSVNKITLE